MSTVNRPFAILKDLLPPRDKPRREKPDGSPTQGEGKPARSAEARQRPPKRGEGQTAARQPAPVPKPEAGHLDPAGGAGAPRGGQRGRGGPPRHRPAPGPAKARETVQPDPAVEAAKAEEAAKAAKAAERAQKQRQLADEGLRALSERYPNLFDRQQPVPLAIGIHKPLLEAARTGELPATVAAVRAAIGRWTSSTPYLAVLGAEAPRIGLDGEPDGAVTAEQAAAASTWLEKRRAQQKARPPRHKRKGGPRGPGKGPAASAAAPPAAPTAQTGTETPTPPAPSPSSDAPGAPGAPAPEAATASEVPSVANAPWDDESPPQS